MGFKLTSNNQFDLCNFPQGLTLAKWKNRNNLFLRLGLTFNNQFELYDFHQGFTLSNSLSVRSFIIMGDSTNIIRNINLGLAPADTKINYVYQRVMNYMCSIQNTQAKHVLIDLNSLVKHVVLLAPRTLIVNGNMKEAPIP